MFCYAFARSLAARGVDVLCDTDSYIPNPALVHETMQLADAFPNIEIKSAPAGAFRFAYSHSTNKWVKLAYCVMRHAVNAVRPRTYIMEPSYGYTSGMEKRCGDDSIYLGHWQSEKYFADIRDELLEQFEFRPFDEPRNMELAKKMASENSVAVHVRRGPDYQFALHLCNIGYYRRAIEYIRSKVDNPRFYVFTDNRDWVRKNFDGIPYTLVDWNECTGPLSFRDMQLMTCARHNIIANSSYSWWGAWLNRNPDKIVTAPKLFFVQDRHYYRTSDVVCDNWIAL